MELVYAFDYLLWPLKNLALHPLMIALSFLVWRRLARTQVDQVTSGVFAFSVVFTPFWVLWLIQILTIAALGQSIGLERRGLILAEMAVALALYFGLSVMSGIALRRGQSLAWPVPAVVGTMAAHALHLNVVADIVIRNLV